MSSTDETNICCACLAPEAEWAGSAKPRCGHSMCLPCCLTWSKTNASCPQCRATFVSAPEPVYHLAAEAYDMRWVAGDMARAVARREARRARDEAHYQQMRASAARRTMFLNQTRVDWGVHCVTCADPVCMANHERRTRWLNRGKLVPLPPACSSLDRTTIGLLLCRNKISEVKLLTLTRYTPVPESRRQQGFMDALERQNDAAKERKQVRAATAGAVTKRHGTTLALARANLATLEQKPGVKVFKGFTPPKRGARTGDLYISGATKAICIGFHLWSFADGSRQRLKDNKWTTVPPIDFEAVD
jgi:hypothetical protein